MPEATTRQPRSARRDGWTPARQLHFLDVLALTRSVTRAAAAAGMSRESAYRLRKRHPESLFASAWDRALLGHEMVARPARPRGPRTSLTPDVSRYFDQRSRSA
jgi:hypothetical protein